MTFFQFQLSKLILFIVNYYKILMRFFKILFGYFKIFIKNSYQYKFKILTILQSPSEKLSTFKKTY